jgi:signal transduction histidine kinase
LFLGLLSSFLVFTIYFEITGESYIGTLRFSILLLPFIFSYYLSRKGHITAASTVLVTIFTIGAWIAIYYWDIRLPAALLSLFLATTVVGILFSSMTGFIYACISTFGVIVFSHLTEYGYHLTDLSWQSAGIGLADALEIGIFLLFTSGITWISNRQTTLSLTRARASEAELKIERDLLEARVQERTAEIERIQIEKVSELYTFIEFGKLSAGLIHDIMSPLTALHIDIETSEIEALQRDTSSSTPLPIQNTARIKASTATLLESSRKIQRIIKLARNQIKVHFEKETFSVRDAIEEILIVNNQRLYHAHIHTKITIPHALTIHSYRTLFIHIITNLISNAIDACIEKSHISHPAKYTPEITIGYNVSRDHICINIKDNGIGIPTSLQETMFNPFHTTKGEKGCGIGLAASRHIAQKYFEGDIQYRARTKHMHKQSPKHIRKYINHPASEFSVCIPSALKA